MKNEGDVKRKVRTIINCVRDSYHFMPPANGYGRAGIPDIIGQVNGKFFAVETKFGKNKPTANQEREIAAILETGGKAWIVSDQNLNSWEAEFKEWAKS